MMRMSHTLPAAIALAFALGLPAAQAQTQGQAPEQSQGQSQAPAQGQSGGQGNASSVAPAPEAGEADFDDAEKAAFADAHQEVMSIREEYVERIGDAEDREQATQLQQEANEKMVGAVDEAGIDVELYGQIARAASQDSELAEELREEMDE